MSRILRIHEDLAEGRISCTELISQKLNLLEKNTHNTSNLILREQALAQAKVVDNKLGCKKTIGLLEGIPFGLKDVYLLQGTPTTGSSDFLRHYQSPYTATAIQKLIDAGAIPIVKENCDSFGHGSTNENSAFGAVKHAYHDNLVAGGSTGGGAVNVAKNYTAFSIGEDTGGSIRQPAGYNQIYGFKPTYGRISRFGVMAYSSSIDCVGPMARYLDDIRLVLNVMSGKDKRDQTSFASQSIKAIEPLDKTVIRIGYYHNFTEHEALDQTIKTDFLNMLEELSKQKFEVKALKFENINLLVPVYYILAMAETASNLARLDGIHFGRRASALDLKAGYSLSRSKYFTTETQRRIIGGNQVLSEGYSDDIYLKAGLLRQKIMKNFKQDFEHVDLILSPVSPNPPAKIGTSLQDPLSMYLSDIYTVGFSLGGLPTLTVPFKTSTGIQITAPKKRDDLILNFAQYLEH